LLPARLEAAAGVGAEVLRADADLVAAVYARTDGEGAPVVIEATGNVKAMESTLALVAAGGRIVIVGLVKDGLGVTLPGLDLTRKEPTIVGSRASVGCFPESLALLREGKIQLGKLVTELAMWDAPAIFAGLAQDAHSVHKAMLVV
jgi:threonine dehydrogenase-like Zn-dependent dehydrogenase